MQWSGLGRVTAASRSVEVTGAGSTFGSSDQPNRVRPPGKRKLVAAGDVTTCTRGGFSCDVGDVEIPRDLSVTRSTGPSCLHDSSGSKALFWQHI